MRSGPRIKRRFTVSYWDSRQLKTRRRGFVSWGNAKDFAERLKRKGEWDVEVIDRRSAT
jgi:hypothetical protein